MPPARPGRRYPIGAEPLAGGEGTSFRVWAPTARRVEVLLESGAVAAHPLTPEANSGYHSSTLAAAAPGMRYRFRLDHDAARRFPDPASRFQPDGPHGPSEIIDPSAYRWHDSDWRGAPLAGAVFYELHVGTFTPAGTFAAAAAELPALRDLGVTVVELMPVADFPGRFGWGYDSVDLFAPTRLYGRPDDLRALVDAAHALGLGIILDVVYNHLGPDGNYLRAFSPHYFTDRYPNDWGEAINFDGPESGPVRDFFLSNAAYWIDELHFDGLRLDATQSMYDASPDPITAAITRRVREAGAGRTTLVIAENEPQDARLVRSPARGGFGLDAAWNDDFHHSARVAAVGRTEAYFSDYRGSAQELVSATRWGYLYQGQYYGWQKRRRGTPAFDLAPLRFVTYLQNHDQVANCGNCRLHQLTAHARARALTGWWLLGPGTPMLFQGQEFAASAPFEYFADHHPELAAKVRRGRSQFVAQFPSLATEDMQARLPDPADPATFARCKLDPKERALHTEWVSLHRDLLTLRREDRVLSRQLRPEGAALGDAAFVLRFFGDDGDDGDDRLLMVNLGRDLQLRPLSEPLLGTPERQPWHVVWTSEQPRYGGLDTPRVDGDAAWHIPSDCTLLLAPRAAATKDAA